MASDFDREDRRQSGGCHIGMGTSEAGTFVRYMLLVPKLPIWRAGTAPIALMIRCYESGETTVSEEPWEA